MRSILWLVWMAVDARRLTLSELGACGEATAQSAIVLNWSLVAFLGLCDGVVVTAVVLAVLYRWRDVDTPRGRMGFRAGEDTDGRDRY